MACVIMMIIDQDCDDHDHDEGGGQYSDHSRMVGRRELQVVVDHSLVVGLVRP